MPRWQTEQPRLCGKAARWCLESPCLLHSDLLQLMSEVTLLRACQSSPMVLEGTVLAALLLPSMVFGDALLFAFQSPTISLASFDGVWSHRACCAPISFNWCLKSPCFAHINLLQRCWKAPCFLSFSFSRWCSETPCSSHFNLPQSRWFPSMASGATVLAALLSRAERWRFNKLADSDQRQRAH